MKIKLASFVVLIQLHCASGKMGGNVPTIINRKLKCEHMLELVEDTWLARCAQRCAHKTDCKSLSYSRHTSRCELYRINSTSAGVNDTLEEDGTVFIDIVQWPPKRTDACWNRPCGEGSRCLQDTQSHRCVEPVSSSCPDGWIESEGKCYHVLSTQKKHSDAECYCRGQGGKLAEPRTGSAVEFLMEIAVTDNATGYWLGLTDQQVHGTWVWLSDGSTINPSYTGWDVMAPADSVDGLDCAAMSVDVSYRWVDASCDSLYNAICERI